MGIMFDIFCIGDNDTDLGARGYGNIRKARKLMLTCFVGSVVVAGGMVSGGDEVVWGLVVNAGEMVVDTLHDVVKGAWIAWIA